MRHGRRWVYHVRQSLCWNVYDFWNEYLSKSSNGFFDAYLNGSMESSPDWDPQHFMASVGASRHAPLAGSVSLPHSRRTLLSGASSYGLNWQASSSWSLVTLGPHLHQVPTQDMGIGRVHHGRKHLGCWCV